MSKKALSEADICDQFITPAIHAAGWEKGLVRREYRITDGQIVVRGSIASRKAPRRADYVMFYRLSPSISSSESLPPHP